MFKSSDKFYSKIPQATLVSLKIFIIFKSEKKTLHKNFNHLFFIFIFYARGRFPNMYCQLANKFDPDMKYQSKMNIDYRPNCH